MIRRPLHLLVFTSVVVTLGFGCNTGSGRRSFGPGSTGANNSGTGGGGGSGTGAGTIGSFSAAAPMSLDRGRHTATVLNDGRVLVTCGENSIGFHVTSEIYDPIANAWSRVDQIAPTQSDGLMIDPANGQPTSRARHTATLMPNNQVLIVGGFGVERRPVGSPVIVEALQSAYLFNPATNSFTRTASLQFNRHSHFAELLGTQNVGVSSGINNITPIPVPNQQGVNQIGATITSTEVYDINLGTWTTVSSSNGNHATGAAGVVGGTLYLIGGAEIGFTNVGGFLLGNSAAPRVETFDVNTGNFASGNTNAVDRIQPAYVVTSNGNLFLAGGRDANLVIQDTTEVLAGTNGQWSNGPTLSSASAGAEAAELSTTSDVILTGGFDSTGTVVQPLCEVYGVLNNAMIGTTNMATGRILHKAVTLNDGRVLIVGGRDNTTTYLTQCEVHTR